MPIGQLPENRILWAPSISQDGINRLKFRDKMSGDWLPPLHTKMILAFDFIGVIIIAILGRTIATAG